MSLSHILTVLIFQCIMYQIVFPNDTTPSEKQKLLSNVLKAFDMSLDFFEENVKEMNMDAIFGLRVSQGVLETTLSAFDQLKPVLTRIIALKAKASAIIEKSLPYLKSSNIKYYNQVSFSVKNQWKLVRPFRRLMNRSIDVNEEDVLTKNGNAYQPCMEAIFGSGNSEPCNVTKVCWRIMLRMDKIGYSLTHQALYFMFAQQIKGCSSIVSVKLQQSSIKGGFDHLYEVICSLMYPQMMVLEKNNKGFIQLDLYFEQALVCGGLIGYEDFLSKTRLLQLLKNQFPSGCYGDPKQNPKRIFTDTANPKTFARPKRTKKMLADGCEAHISGIASALLSVYIRWLLLGSDQVHANNILDTIQKQM